MKNIKDKDQKEIHNQSLLIENFFESFGKFVRVQNVKVEGGFMFFDMELALGTRISEIIGLDKDLASVMASSTGKVEIYPLIGTSLIQIKVPISKTKLKEENYKIIRVEVEAPKIDDWTRIRRVFGMIFKKIGEMFYWIGRKLI